MTLKGLLKHDELASLLRILGQEDARLEDCLSSFTRAFHTFRACVCISVLLEHDLLYTYQRCVAFYVLAESYRSHASGVNPFLPVLLTAVDVARASPSPATLPDALWVSQLLMSAVTNKETSKRSARGVYTELDVSVRHASGRVELPDFQDLKKLYDSVAPHAPSLRGCDVAATLSTLRVDAAAGGGSSVGRGQKASLPVAPPVLGLNPTGAATPRVQRSADTSRLDSSRGGGDGAASSEVAAIPLRPPPPSLTLAQLLDAADACIAVSNAQHSTPVVETEMQSRVSGEGQPSRRRPLRATTVEDMPRVTATLMHTPPPTASAVQALSDGLLQPRGFRPHFMRLAPPMLPLHPSESVHAACMDPPPLLWDMSLHRDAARSRAVTDLVSRALKAPLAQAQVDALTRALDEEPSALWTCGLAPSRLEALITHNPALAVDVLQRVRTHAAPLRFTEYLSDLIRMPLSLHSMEVVNQLAMLPQELPPDFLRLYISHCISSCEGVGDKYMQTRLVRLVCVFLQSLIRHRMAHVGDLFVEIQAFCIEFSRIKEAAGLFRVLKQMDAGGVPVISSAAAGATAAASSSAAGGGV